jgi:WD40 repeat protein
VIRTRPRRVRAELRSPYPGIRPFRREESRIFFGRDEQVESLLARLQRCRFLAVVGSSGSGKSSLIRAGLIPKLEAGELGATGSNWHIADLHPGTSPLLNLARAVLRSGILGDDWPSDAANFDISLGLLLAQFGGGRKALGELLRRSDIPEYTNLLIVADQFEEIFRFYNDRSADDALKFVNLLMAVTEEADLPVYVVLAMRSDFLGECALFPQLPERLNDAQFLCPRLTADQMREAIMLPARSFRGDVEPALASQLLDDVGTNSDQLPLIQHCLARMWDAADGLGPRSLTLEQYGHESAGANERPVFVAMSHHADELMAGFDARRVEAVFRALAARGPGGQMVRRSVSIRQLAEETSATEEPAEIDRVQTDIIRIVDAFRADGHNFLTPSVQEASALGPDTMVDVSHESLLRQWKQLNRWLQDEIKSAAELRNLIHEANRWKDANENRGLLLRDLKLRQVVEWKKGLPSPRWPLRYAAKDELELATRYLQDSLTRQREEEETAARRAHQESERQLEIVTLREREKVREAEQKRQQAEATQLQAEARRRQAELASRRALRFAFLVAVIAALAVSAMCYAFYARKTALKAQQDANDRQEEAERLKTNQERMSDAFNLLSNATDSVGRTPLRSGLLSFEAWRLARQLQVKGPNSIEQLARDALRKSLSMTGGVGLYANHGSIEHIAVHETQDGKLHWIAASGTDGLLALWDTRDGVEKARAQPLPFGYEHPVRSLRISEDGRWLIAQSGADLTTLWDLKDAALPAHILQGFSDHYYGVTAKGSYLLLRRRYAGNPNTRIKEPAGLPLLNLSEDDPSARPARLEEFPDSQNNSFSRDGRWFAMVGPSASAMVYDLSQRKAGELLKGVSLVGPAGTQSLHRAPTRACNGEFTDGGDRLIAYLDDGTVRIWQRRDEHAWNRTGEDLPLPGIDRKAHPTVRTATRGLCALVAIPADSSADPKKGARGLFFDFRTLDTPKELGGLDPALVGGLQAQAGNAGKNVHVDARTKWLAARFRPTIAGAAATDGIQLWNLQPKARATLLKPIFLEVREGLKDFLLTTDARWVIAKCLDGTTRLWDLEAVARGTRLPIVVRGHDGVVSAFALRESPFGLAAYHWLVTGGSDGSLRVWNLHNLNTGADRVTSRGPTGEPSGHRYGQLSFDNRTFVQSRIDGRVAVWKLTDGTSDGKANFFVPAKRPDYPCLALSDDGRWLLTYGKDNDGRAELWNLEALQKKADANVAKLLTTDQKKQLEKDARHRPLKGMNGVFQHLEVTADGKWVIISAVKPSMYRRPQILYAAVDSSDAANAGGPVELRPLPGLKPDAAYLGLVQAQAMYAAIDEDVIYVGRLGDDGPHKVLEPKPGNHLLAVEKSQDNLRLIVKYEKEPLFVCQLSLDAAGRPAASDRRVLRPDRDADSSFTDAWVFGGKAIHVGNRWVIIEGPDVANTDKDQLKQFVWDLKAKGNALNAKSVVVSPARATNVFAVSPGGRWLLTSPSGLGELWDLDSDTKDGLPARTVLGSAPTNRFSSDGGHLVCTDERRISVWSLLGPVPALAGVIDGTVTVVDQVAVSRDGNWLALSDRTHGVRVWNLNAPSVVSSLAFGPQEISSPRMYLYHDASYVTVIEANLNSLSACPLTSEPLALAAERAIGRNLTAKEWAELGVTAEYHRTFATLPVFLPKVVPSRTPQTRGAPAKEIAKQSLFGDEPNKNGELTDDDPVDRARNKNAVSKRFPVELRVGKSYVIDMKSTVVDSYLRLEDDNGVQVAFDDDSGGHLDARIVYRCKRSGTYTIIATTFDRKTGPFSLSAFEEPKVPAEGDLSLTDNMAKREGTLRWEDYEMKGIPYKVYSLALTAGQVCQIELASRTFDAVLRLEDSDGVPLFSNDNGGGRTDARIVFRCEKTAEYRIVVTSAVRQTGDFVLRVQTR